MKRHSKLFSCFVLSALLLGTGTSLRADHPIPVIEADAYVTRNTMTLRLTIFAEDLYMFHEIEPNEQDFLEPDDLEEAMELHEEFLLERILIRDASGELLKGQVIDVDPFEMPEQGLPMASLMEYQVIYELEYRFKEPPEFLTFTQEISEENAVFPCEVQLRLKQSGSDSGVLKALRPREPFTTRFDWSNPPLSLDASQKEWEEWLEREREEMMGITSYSRVYSFIYIEDFEVRHEILIPLVTLASSVDIQRADPAFLEIAEQDAARTNIEAYFRKGNPVEIDGIVVQPVVDRIDYYGVNFKDFAKQAERKRASMANGRVGVILSYSAKTPPNEVKVTWDQFNKHVFQVDSVVIAYDKTTKAEFSETNKENNTYVWTSEGRAPRTPVGQVSQNLIRYPTVQVPIVSMTVLVGVVLTVGILLLKGTAGKWLLAILLVGGAVAAGTWPVANLEARHPLKQPPTLTDKQANDIFSALHANTYRAFDYRHEDDIYQALQASVGDQLLEDLYLKIRKGLEMQEQGGAVSKVREVAITEGAKMNAADTVDWPGFQYDCVWTVSGTVEHWGHIHERINRYNARFTVQLLDESWRITDMEILEQKRLSFKSRLRTF